MIRQHWYWVPIQITLAGQIRVEAFTPEEAQEKVENHDFNPDEVLQQDIIDVCTTGAPMMQEVS